MPLEDPAAIDLIAAAPGGGVRLVITDGGVTSDPSARLTCLEAKLRTYAAHAASETFAAEHPGVDLSDVEIQVICRTEPTPEMRRITAAQVPGEPSREVRVTFEVFAPTPMAAPASGAAGTARKDGPQTRLTLALARGDREAALAALDEGAAADHVDPIGLSPLHYAIHGKSADLVRLLIERGARFPAATQGGRSLWVAARSRGAADVERALEEAGVRPTMFDRAFGLWHGLRRKGRPEQP